MQRGYIHVYTGNGKGKTTAAVGLAVRAAGAGMKVLFCQFLKGTPSCEMNALELFGEAIKTIRSGSDNFITGVPSDEDVRQAREAFINMQDSILNSRYDLVILDEICAAVNLGCIPLRKLLEFMANKPEHLELVLTGREAPAEVIAKADLVTEMKEVKHYFSQGVPARKGIEL